MICATHDLTKPASLRVDILDLENVVARPIKYTANFGATVLNARVLYSNILSIGIR